MSKPLTLHKVEFVLGSELFDGLAALAEFHGESDPDYTWGSCNRSLVTGEAILDHLQDVGVDAEDDIVVTEFHELRRRIEALPDGLQTHVDLEN